MSSQLKWLTRDNDIREMAKRLLAEHAGKLLIIGHSMGARVAIEMAYQAPERVEGLVLANTGHAPLQQGERERRQRKILMAHGNMLQMVAEWLPPMLAEGRDTDASLVADLTDMATQIGPIVHQRQIEALINVAKRYRNIASDFLSSFANYRRQGSLVSSEAASRNG